MNQLESIDTTRKYLIPFFIKLEGNNFSYPIRIVEDTPQGLIAELDLFKSYSHLIPSVNPEQYSHWLILSDSKGEINKLWELRVRLSIATLIVFGITLHDYFIQSFNSHITEHRSPYKLESNRKIIVKTQDIVRLQNLYSSIQKFNPTELKNSIQIVLLDMAMKNTSPLDVRFAFFVILIESLLLTPKEGNISQKLAKRLQIFLGKNKSFIKKFKNKFYDKRSRILHGNPTDTEKMVITKTQQDDLKQLEDWSMLLLEDFFLGKLDLETLIKQSSTSGCWKFSWFKRLLYMHK